MKIKSFKAIYPNLDLITSTDAFFDTVKYRYPDYYKTGFFNQTLDDAIYVYQVKTNKNTHLGFLATIDMKNYVNGKIKIHEKTLAAKEQKSMELLLQRKAMIKPVLLTYPSNDAVFNALMGIKSKENLFLNVTFEDNGEVHTIYSINNPELITQFSTLIDSHVQEAYIADGHHRLAVMSHLSKMNNAVSKPLKFDKLLCSFFAFDQLEVSEFNRVIDILNDISPTQLMACISTVCDISILKKAKRPTQKHELTLFINKEWYILKWKPAILEKYKEREVVLDTTLLNNEILEAMLGMKDVRFDNRIEYVKGSKGIDGAIRKCIEGPSQIVFFLYPIAIEEFQQISDLFQTLPPKSTYFEPRMKNGLISQAF